MVIYHFEEYKLAKKMVTELPKLIKIVDKSINDLAQYTHYIDVVAIVWELNQLSILLNSKYVYYLNIYNKKALYL